MSAIRVELNEPIIIAHRGASGYVPEHTLAAYALAIEMGADYIEPDLVVTRDGVLVARHENEISGTTDVATHPEFTERKATKIVDGGALTGWFTEDFTVAELKTLRAIERIPALRPANTRFDGDFQVPTLTEVIDLVQAANERFSVEARRTGCQRKRIVGVYPETKHPSYFASIGLPMEATLVHELHRSGMRGRDAPVFIQSFEVANLQALRRMTSLPLIQLLSAGGRPYDFVVSGDTRSGVDLTSPDNLSEIAAYADGIGVDKALVIPTESSGWLTKPTRLVSDAHEQGLLVHAWTFRAENYFLPADFRTGNPSDPAEHGDLVGELLAFLAFGVDGLFTDMPNLGVRARQRAVAPRCGA